MIIIFAFLIVLVVAMAMIKNKVSIDIKSFFEKGFMARRGLYGVYCFCGKQGTGKTFSTVQFLSRNRNFPIYSNISLQGFNYVHFSTFKDMLQIKDQNCIIVYDEIFSALAKSTKLNQDVLTFLSQQRKKQVIFITTAQEWLEIPMTLRRYVRYQIDCSIWNILPFSILVERYRDGENMHWDNLENDYVAPIIATKITKMAKRITTYYDTWETISSFDGSSGALRAPEPSPVGREPRAFRSLGTSRFRRGGSRWGVAL